HQRVRQGYLEISKQESARVKIINRQKSVEEIHQIILNLCSGIGNCSPQRHRDAEKKIKIYGR
ncbi:MAG: hypothetical protein AB1414_01910, partial [bacterium]